MESIRTYSGVIGLCSGCGQPGDENGEHFLEQWDGVGCNDFPMTGTLHAVDWDPGLLAEIKRCYPNPGTMTTTPAGSGPKFYILPQDSPKWIDRYGLSFRYAVTGQDVTAWCRAIAEHAGADIRADAGW